MAVKLQSHWVSRETLALIVQQSLTDEKQEQYDPQVFSPREHYTTL